MTIKAASADMTWDEAWTYLFYGRSAGGFLVLDYANDHPLNSLLVWLATRLFGSSELVVRLPNVAAAGLYLYATGRLVRLVRPKLFAFALCALQPCLFDYLALARGYGIAAALMQWGIVEHAFAGGGERAVRRMLAAALLASLSIFSTVVTLWALALAHLAATRRAPAGRHLRFTLGCMALGLLPAAGLAWVSRVGLPLYGGRAGFLDAVPRSIARMYVPDAWADPFALAATAGVAVLLLAGRRRFTGRTVTLLLAGALGLAAMWIAARLLGKPLPTGRVLLPFLPLWTLAVVAMLDDIATVAAPAGRRAIGVAGALVCGGLAALFLHRLHFQRYADYPEDYRLRSRLAQALAAGPCLPPDVWSRYGHLYYIDRWFPPGRRPPDTECPALLSRTTPAASQGGRTIGLDLVRACAILFVLASHCGDTFAQWLGGSAPPWLSVSGFFGVELFFVLSGFLIGRLLLDIAVGEPSRRAWLVFMVRRWMRTLPVYYLWLLALALFWPPRFWEPDHRALLWSYLPRYATLTQNLAWPMRDGWFGVSWSLTVEEWFYLSYSALLLGVTALLGRRAGFPLVTALFLVVPVALRWHMPDTVSFDEVLSKTAVLRLDAIAFGTTLAWLQSRGSRLFGRARLPALLIGIVLIGGLWSGRFDPLAGAGAHVRRSFLFDLASLGFALCLPAAAALRRLPGLAMTPIRAISRQSYCIYIVHLSILEFTGYYMAQWRLPVPAAIAAAPGLIWLVSWASWRWVEAPILARRPAQSGRRG